MQREEVEEEEDGGWRMSSVCSFDCNLLLSTDTTPLNSQTSVSILFESPSTVVLLFFCPFSLSRLFPYYPDLHHPEPILTNTMATWLNSLFRTEPIEEESTWGPQEQARELPR